MSKYIILFTLCILVFQTSPNTYSEYLPESFILVESGSFNMGSMFDELEMPVHNVKISRSFYMSKYEMTQKEWWEVMGNNPSRYKGDNRPVENVSWYEAIEYCNRLSMKEGLTPCYSGSGDNIRCDFSLEGYRLPTEAEWEYAARGGNKSKGYIYAGSNSIEEVAWYVKNSNHTTHEVGMKQPNEFGLYDMSGNVHEWCWDWIDSYSNNAQFDPQGPEGPRAGKLRANRGGSAFIYARGCRVTDRHSAPPKVRKLYLGFRPVMTAP